MSQKEIYEEVIEEIGTQTLARLKINIFELQNIGLDNIVNFNTYAAYESSIIATNNTFKAYGQHKNNPQGFGQYYEELEIGQNNIKDSLLNTGNKTYTTDTLADIKKAQGIIASGKKIENLNPKDLANFKHTMRNYHSEVENMDFSAEKIGNLATKNHMTTDTATLDKKGNVINSAQLKVIKNPNDLLKDRYLYGEDAPNELKMPFDDYKKHKEKLESWASNKNGNVPKEKQEKAKIALEKLNKNNITNRLMCENPRATAMITQSTVAATHIAQTGFSDAVIVALSTLASGAIYEIKDIISAKNPETKITTRIKRLINKIIKSFKDTFVRGASFGAIDILVGVCQQVFKSLAGGLNNIWNSIRSSAKSIFNAIVKFIKGDTRSFRELTSEILKSLFSALAIISTVALEKTIEAALGGTFLGFIAPFVAPALAIIIGAMAVVMTRRSIDLAVDSLFAAFARRDIAKKRAKEIYKLCEEQLPLLISKTNELEKIMQETHMKRLTSFDCSFKDYQNSLEDADINAIFNALSQINKLYDRELTYVTNEDIKCILQNTNNNGLLAWKE